MKSITIYPESDNQYDQLKNLLEEMKVDYVIEIDSDIIELTDVQKSVLSDRLLSAEKGNVISRNEAKETFVRCLK